MHTYVTISNGSYSTLMTKISTQGKHPDWNVNIRPTYAKHFLGPTTSAALLADPFQRREHNNNISRNMGFQNTGLDDTYIGMSSATLASNKVQCLPFRIFGLFSNIDCLNNICSIYPHNFIQN